MEIYLSTLLAICGLYLLAAASPGPNFFIISQLSLSGRRRLAILVALGIAVGSTTWATLAMLGVAALLAQLDWLYAGIRLAGALYLIWLGGKLLIGAARPAPNAPREIGIGTTAHALRTGLFTSLSNPKSGAFWTGVFATTFPAQAPLWFYLMTGLLVALMSLGWHLGIALVFTSARVQAGYQRAQRVIDAVCGGILVSLGVHLASER
ncbi:LysE family transporter [Rhodospirillaceae bacterium SYSU D60014]|uniref:LysE family translocator n=1 Tax=Virgifigura deserti TaxID=2268457 RepID=UPI000E664E0B